MRVIVADDALIVREGLTRLLQEEGHEVVASSPRMEPVLALVALHRPDVVLVDIRMPPTFTDEGLRLAAEIHSRHPAVGVLVLSQYLVAAYATDLLERSPSHLGYLLKDHILDPNLLESALGRVASGGTYVDPLLIAHLIESRGPLAALTDREREVLALIAEGLSDRGIADRLVVSLNTVGTHVRHVFAKLDLPDDPSGNRRVNAVLTYLANA